MNKFFIILFTAFTIGCVTPKGVIGVAYNQKGIVRHVFPKSPADLAGIKLDDRILNTKDLRGKVGTMCLVKYERSGTYFEQLIKRVDVDTLYDGSW